MALGRGGQRYLRRRADGGAEMEACLALQALSAPIERSFPDWAVPDHTFCIAGLLPEGVVVVQPGVPADAAG